MNADAFRHLYGYHFAQNHELWNKYIVLLTYDEFTRKMGYSYASVRDQFVHMIGADDLWFSELQNIAPLQPPADSGVDDREDIRAYWNAVEKRMHSYLQGLRDDMLPTTPIQEPEDDRGLIVWQVLLHVINHGTDHRAQMLRFLSDLGAKTEAQDYIFYVYEHPL